jgi:methyl-accepting chemotaxis protein|tara:strand:- start:9808 stop:12153 length:2346 start_codon:yes stop_codon:yes gene_type:complete
MFGIIKKQWFNGLKASVTSKKQASGDAKFGIGPRLIASFSIVAVLTVAISAVSWFSLGRLTAAEKDLIEQKLPAITLALNLANETTALTAATPQLSGAMSEAERLQSYKRITVSANQATERLDALREYMNDNASLKEINDGLVQIQDSLTRLNDQVHTRLELAARLETVTPKLEEARNILDTGLTPFLLPLRLRMIQNSDKWSDTLTTALEQAANDVKPEYDTSSLSTEAMSVLSLQEDVFTFKSSGFQMLNLLAAGAQATTIEGVRDFEAVFLASISTMGGPLSSIEEQTGVEKAKQLSSLFQDFLEMGVKDNSDASVNVFQTRVQELEAAQAADKIVDESQFLAGALVQNVHTFTSEVQGSFASATAANQRLADTTKITLIICAVSALLVTILIGLFYIRRNIIRRLLLLVASADRLSQGDLNAEIYRDGNDEIARMGRALVGFRDTARDAEKARNEAEEERRKREEEKSRSEAEQREAERAAREERERLAREANETKERERNQLADTFEGSVKHLVEKFAAAAAEMSKMSKSMSVSADDTAGRTTTVASASDLATSSVNAVATATEELTASISEISRQVSDAASIAGEAVSEAERTNMMVTSLNEAASRIGAVVDLINNIAGQTNLLALNATIEAARAGDAGKGFAVVASEVKNLAAQTARATEEISEQIKAVQEETGNAVGAIGGITQTIGKINSIATMISAAVEEQGAATDEISRSVRQAADGAQEVSQNINLVKDAAVSTGETAQEVQGVSNELAKEVMDLDREVEGFLKKIRAK